MPRKYLLILDIDNCMYKRSSGVADQLKENIISFGMNKYGLSYQEADTATERGLKTKGLSVAGYIDDYGLDNIAEYLQYIHHHDMNHEDIIDENRPFVDWVETVCKQDAYVYLLTNGIPSHAHKCLKALGFSEDIFKGRVISCFEQWGVVPSDHVTPPTNWENKPWPIAYERAMNYITEDLGDAVEGLPIIFADDTYANLRVPKELGWTTIFVKEAAKGREENPADFPDASWMVCTISGLKTLPCFE